MQYIDLDVLCRGGWQQRFKNFQMKVVPKRFSVDFTPLSEFSPISLTWYEMLAPHAYKRVDPVALVSSASDCHMVEDPGGHVVENDLKELDPVSYASGR